MKNELLARKRKKTLNKDYLSAEKCVKNYREKQKSYSGFAKKVNNRFVKNSFDKTREGKPVILVRISG